MGLKTGMVGRAVWKIERFENVFSPDDFRCHKTRHFEGKQLFQKSIFFGLDDKTGGGWAVPSSVNIG